jgi:hypothetical protein
MIPLGLRQTQRKRRMFAEEKQRRTVLLRGQIEAQAFHEVIFGLFKHFLTAHCTE